MKRADVLKVVEFLRGYNGLPNENKLESKTVSNIVDIVKKNLGSLIASDSDKITYNLVKGILDDADLPYKSNPRRKQATSPLKELQDALAELTVATLNNTQAIARLRRDLDELVDILKEENNEPDRT